MILLILISQKCSLRSRICTPIICHTTFYILVLDSANHKKKSFVKQKVLVHFVCDQAMTIMQSMYLSCLVVLSALCLSLPVSFKVPSCSNGFITGIRCTINNILCSHRKKVQTKVKKSPVASWRSFFSMAKSSTTAKRKLLRHPSEPNNMKTPQALSGRAFPIHSSLLQYTFQYFRLEVGILQPTSHLLLLLAYRNDFMYNPLSYQCHIYGQLQMPENQCIKKNSLTLLEILSKFNIEYIWFNKKWNTSLTELGT